MLGIYQNANPTVITQVDLIMQQSCMDSIGEWECPTIWKGEGSKLKRFIRAFHSVGLFYSAMTQRCGLEPKQR